MRHHRFKLSIFMQKPEERSYAITHGKRRYVRFELDDFKASELPLPGREDWCALCRIPIAPNETILDIRLTGPAPEKLKLTFGSPFAEKAVWVPMGEFAEDDASPDVRLRRQKYLQSLRPPIRIVSSGMNFTPADRDMSDAVGIIQEELVIVIGRRGEVPPAWDGELAAPVTIAADSEEMPDHHPTPAECAVIVPGLWMAENAAMGHILRLGDYIKDKPRLITVDYWLQAVAPGEYSNNQEAGYVVKVQLPDQHDTWLRTAVNVFHPNWRIALRRAKAAIDVLDQPDVPNWDDPIREMFAKHEAELAAGGIATIPLTELPSGLAGTGLVAAYKDRDDEAGTQIVRLSDRGRKIFGYWLENEKGE